jgi:nucleotide-binding universal stress UspA family protein
MTSIEAVGPVDIRTILFLTDFSEPTDLAIPYLSSLARRFDAQVLAMHVLTGVPPAGSRSEDGAAYLDRAEEAAALSMERLDSELTGVAHETLIVREPSVWPAARKLIYQRNVDLIVIGSQRHPLASRAPQESVSDEIFRHADVPVLVVGPEVRSSPHQAGKFHRILYATDFSSQAQAAGPFAFSLAEEDESRLMLLNVIAERTEAASHPDAIQPLWNALHRLHETMAPGAKFWCRPEASVRFGDPLAEIVGAASDFRADLIVIGVHAPCSRACGGTRCSRVTAREIVERARCPVLSVRDGVQTVRFEVNYAHRFPRLA